MVNMFRVPDFKNYLPRMNANERKFKQIKNLVRQTRNKVFCI